MNDWTTKVLGLLLDDVDQNIINALKEYKNKEAKE